MFFKKEIECDVNEAATDTVDDVGVKLDNEIDEFEDVMFDGGEKDAVDEENGESGVNERTAETTTMSPDASRIESRQAKDTAAADIPRCSCTAEHPESTKDIRVFASTSGSLECRLPMQSDVVDDALPFRANATL